MRRPKIVDYKQKWNALTEMYGNLCFYCRQEIATTIDHVVPWSWDQDDSIDNLVLACGLCNCLASDKMFETVYQKQAYIVAHKKKYKNKRAICTECLLPYTYRTHSPSLFLCSECYDQEYGKRFSETERWKKWVGELLLAGIVADAHKAAKEKAGPYHKSNKGTFMAVLIDRYSQTSESDEYFLKRIL